MHNVTCSVDRVKMLVYDGTGLVLIWKRLDGAKFKWPATKRRGDAAVRGATGRVVRRSRLAAGVRTTDQAATAGRVTADRLIAWAASF